MMWKNKSLLGRNYATISYLMMVVFTVIILLINIFLYLRLQELFKERLQMRLLSIVETASVGIDPIQIAKINGLESVGSMPYIKTVNYLRAVREKNENLKYIYILRKTDNSDVLQFVADADSLDPDAKIDLNGDDTIDESDALNAPGDPYEIGPEDLIKHGFLVATVDNKLFQDQWGTFLSAFAPISNADGKVNELIGIDVEVSDYIRITNIALIPFGLSLMVLLVILFAQTTVLVRMWGSRVDLLRELDRQKDTVFHMVAHQFKGPVTTINFTTELLLDGTYGELSADQKEHVSTIRAASQKMGSQSEMVLDAAKISSGQLPIEAKEVDLNQLMQEVIEEAKNHAKERKVNLEVKLPAEKLPTAILDKKYTQMALDNLLSNATKYTGLKAPGGDVVFSVHIQDKTLYCAVKDNGIGIPKKDQDNIFKELYRATNSGKEGTGLGLHVAMGAVQSQGGKLYFESKENEGTTFFIELPLNISEKKGLA